ncbi:unnamed protein product [Echinostoma caproni]|uniref:Uncharacterized protein n=1 Tax=Echinostoma caproni TaxID=27848 RepID=A0A183AUA2_9TREM|nr:unnamed protein product [Echinostoma caproni]
MPGGRISAVMDALRRTKKRGTSRSNREAQIRAESSQRCERKVKEIDGETDQVKKWMHTREHTTEGILDARLAVATTSPV